MVFVKFLLLCLNFGIRPLSTLVSGRSVWLEILLLSEYPVVRDKAAVVLCSKMLQVQKGPCYRGINGGHCNRGDEDHPSPGTGQ